jgi:sulfite reductase (NADPH) flavoprotein alpha-component|tara:strand:- start:1779 stop:3527 length:1749 start_codon:yes stop_codon:yes gene_type:complete
MNKYKKIETGEDIKPFSYDQEAWISGFIAGMKQSVSVTNNSLIQDHNKNLINLDILFGTQTGNSEAIAEDMSKIANDAGFKTNVNSLDNITMDILGNMENVAIITSTYGEGEMPDNAQLFWDALSANTAPNLSNIKYSVLALGDTGYEEFCHAGKLIDTRFEQLGATRMQDRVDCDVDYEELSEKWISSLITKWKPETQVTKEKLNDLSNLKEYNRKNPYSAKLLSNRMLSGVNSNKEIMHYEIDLRDSGLKYEVGDSLSIFPINKQNLVNKIIERLGVEFDFVPGGYENYIRLLLTEKFEILTPTKKLIEYIAKNSNDKKLKSIIDQNNNKELENYKWGMDVLDFMNINPNFKIDVNEFLALLKSLQHRTYSISSSLNKVKNEVHLTVSSVRWQKDSRKYNGVCSTFLADDCALGENIKVFFTPNKSFRLPDDNKDIIMIGPGTGIAPFRAFLQEREYRNSSGKNWLFFGDQTKNDDFIYKNELEDYLSSGVLNKLDLAFSRDQKDKIYVQNIMYENKNEFYNWLGSGAYLYICGDANRMAKDVEDMIIKIIMECSNISFDAAFDYLNNLKREKRYLRDVY